MKKGNWMASLAIIAGVSFSGLTSTQAAFTSVRAIPEVAEAKLGSAGTVSLSVALKTVLDNSTTTQINWNNVTLPTGWKTADAYIQMTSVVTASNGGIETYMDNTALDASPRFDTSTINGQTPAGLINTVRPNLKLPTAWSVRSSTSPLSVAAVDPNANAGESYLWFFHLDKAQVAIPNTASAWPGDADPYVTVQNATGIHYAQGPLQFGAPAAAPVSNYYMEANFSTAITPATYRSNKVFLEAFTL